MKAYNTYIHILSLDSIFRLLTWQERLLLHHGISKRKEMKFTLKLQVISDWIAHAKWEAPIMKYGQDRLLHFENKKGNWQLIDAYIIQHSYIPDQINDLLDEDL
ncbi:hypothetical protein OKE68_05750 [Riemerella anatipestifer]|uniref:Uncharacterized protein n=1 Tax=Riemerella anatipestifer TaxID=34085 RepID=A0AAP3AP79_RIEAN|nr:hypothetical protein [Riemerella anatipestifer]MCW0512095.1 hypothetical protein [Riemerella anatipestifer]MCW0520564.1 hypothetical protein [Riemerella anatipestifer]MCW0523818.1 hypothetical protein [Riemerella anatipestifer]MDD1540231.1 hypothetical protein [Riemerella anatipestifer]MDR7797916.1 hypothetical protein [Riemerella anatipestifer]